MSENEGRELLGGRYRILEPLGAGYQGVVYRCRDERLHRDVAIKTLHPGLVTDDEARELARREAFTLASLKHANIGTIHDIGTHGDEDFLVMELVEGVTLEDMLQTEGPLSVRQLLHLGIQLADGLAAAHDKRIVHRDIKPGNLRVTAAGTLKILDFGVAGLLGDGSTGATEMLLSPARNTVYTSAVAGTIPYMSPERLHGALADARSEVYSVGIVLYEMATGRHPFPGPVDLRLIDRILEQEPPRLRDLNPRLPRALQTVIQKAMEKDPERRYQTVLELKQDLERLAARRPPWGRVALLATTASLLGLGIWLESDQLNDRLHSRLSAGSVRSVVIMPSPGLLVGARPIEHTTEESPTAALTGEIAAALSRIDTLRVVTPARTSLGAHSSNAPQEYGSEFGADAVVEARVEDRGDRIRVRIDVTETKSGRRLRRRFVDRPAGEIAGISRAAASTILAALHIAPTIEDAHWLQSPPHILPEAYTAYLQGRQWLLQDQEEGCRRACGSFEHAVALDPMFADAYGALARAYYGTPSDLLPALHAIEKARAAADTALLIDPRNVEAYIVRACSKAWDDMDIQKNPEQNWSNTWQDLEQALLLEPGSALARRLHVLALVSTERYEAATAELRRAWAGDPLSPHSWVNSLWPLLDDGKYEEVIAASSQIVAQHPEAWDAWLLLGEGCRRAGQLERSSLANSEARRRMRFFLPRRWFGCEPLPGQQPAPSAQIRASDRRIPAPGDVLITDISAFDGSGEVLRIDPATGTQTPIARGGAFTDPMAIARTDHGDLFALDLHARVLVRLDPSTGEQHVISLGQFFESPHGIALGPNGDIFVGDWNFTGQGSVIRVDPHSGAQSVVASGSPFANALGVAVLPDGDLVVADNAALESGAIFRVTPAGVVSVLASGGYLTRPSGVAVDSRGRIYVADYDALGGTGAILRIHPQTGAQAVVSSGGAFIDPFNIAVDSKDQLWVTDVGSWTAGRVVCVDPVTGKQTRVYEGGALVAPVGVTIVPGIPPEPESQLAVHGTLRLVADAVFDSVTVAGDGLLMVDAPLTVRNHLVVAGSLVARSPIRVDGNLVLEPGGVLTHPPRLFDGLVVQVAGRLEVQAGGRIDLDGRGLLGGYTVATQRSGETFDESGRTVSGSTGLGTAGAGGSYGGRGGDSSTGGRAGSSYGSNTDPRWLAAGGGSGGAGGGSGGGRATIRAGACTVNGVIGANGAAGARSRSGAVGGGGAGGSIRLDVQGVLTGSGHIRATGGPSACGTGCGGAGGGGRIAITCGTCSIPRSNIVAEGGQGGIAGSAGTVFIRSPNEASTAQFPSRDQALDPSRKASAGERQPG